MKNYKLFVEDVDNKDIKVGNPYFVIKCSKNKNNEDYFVIRCEIGNYIISNKNPHYKKISREEKELYNDIINFIKVKDYDVSVMKNNMHWKKISKERAEFLLDIENFNL